MTLLNAISIDEIRMRGAISEADVMALRRAFYADGVIDPIEAEALFALNAACADQAPAWANCFVEMLTDYLVNQARPEGYVTLENAEWLVAQITRDGRVDSRTELELLVNVIDKARWSPQSLVAFALDQVKRAVVDGTGPLRDGKTLAPGTINEAEVELLKRILYAFGGDGNIAITRAEAEMLFEINDATQSGENAESWQDLFVKAIANCVMCASGYAPPSREQALAREAWLATRGELSPGSMFAGAARSIASGVLAAYREQNSEERAIAALERQKVEIVTAEEITVVEAQWLAERIGRDGKITPNETALLAFIAENSPKIAPEIEALIDRSGVAAARPAAVA